MEHANHKLTIAIDGPSGAGKSTVAKKLAKELGYIYLDTGAMYRAFALKALEEGIDPNDEKALKRSLQESLIELVEEGDRLKVFLNGSEVTDRIRDPKLSQMASIISAQEVVRKRMVELQRSMARGGGVVAEGRDMGTVVYTQAEVKIFLSAAPDERARRRYEELKAQAKGVTLKETLDELNTRDRRDTERAVAPLRAAEDAVVIDSTALDAEGVLHRIIQEVKKKSKREE